MQKEKNKKMDGEIRKLKKAEKNIAEFFADLKREIIDKNNEEETIKEGSNIKVKEAKAEAKGGSKNFLRFLFTRITGKSQSESRQTSKEDFIKFIK